MSYVGEDPLQSTNTVRTVIKSEGKLDIVSRIPLSHYLPPCVQLTMKPLGLLPQLLLPLPLLQL